MLINGVEYVKRQIKYNITPKIRSKSDIKAIVIHYTANYDEGANASSHYKYWNNANRESSCDVVIDDHSIWKINDWYKNYTWQIGDGDGKYHWSNYQVIGIEMCVNKDGNFNKTIDNTIEYIRYLHQNGFTKTLIRHYDASRKLCPIMFVDLNIKGWNKAYTDFRNKVFAKEKKEPYHDSEILKYGFEKGWYIGEKYKENDPVTWKKLIWVLRNFEDSLKK